MRMCVHSFWSNIAITDIRRLCEKHWERGRERERTLKSQMKILFCGMISSFLEVSFEQTEMLKLCVFADCVQHIKLSSFCKRHRHPYSYFFMNWVMTTLLDKYIHRISDKRVLVILIALPKRLIKLIMCQTIWFANIQAIIFKSD